MKRPRNPNKVKPATTARKPKGKVEFESSPDGAKRLIPYDVSDVIEEPDGIPRLAASEALMLDEEPLPVRSEAAEDAQSFVARIAARRQDLVTLLVRGVPPVEYLPASEGMLVRGKRHQIAAPKKTGKSIGALVHWCDTIAAGCKGVLVLDRENGREEYARRLHGIFEYKGYNSGDLRRFRHRFHYVEFPAFRRGDGEELAAYVERHGIELVVFDSQRMFLTDLGLAEDSTDDYSVFMHELIDPLFQTGIATVILDNTGHSNTDRPRGTSSKGDLNEVLLTMEALKEFDLSAKGQLRLKITHSRAGTKGEWYMDIGGGVFGSWVDPAGAESVDDTELREAVMEVARAKPGIGIGKLLKEVRAAGVSVGQERGLRLIQRWLDDPRLLLDRHPDGGVWSRGPG